MKLSMLDMLRMWAAITGLVLVAGYFGAVWFGAGAHSIVPLLPLLVTGIGGFELVLFAQDLLHSRRRHHG